MNDDALGAQQSVFQRGSLDEQVETVSRGNKRKRKARVSNRMVPDGGANSSGSEGKNGEFQERFELSRGGGSSAEGMERVSTAVGDDEGGASSVVPVAPDSNRGGRRSKTLRVSGGASTAAEAATTAALQDDSRLRWLQDVDRGGDVEEVLDDVKDENRGGAGASRRGGGERPSKIPRRLGLRASSEAAAAAVETVGISGFQEHVSSISGGGVSGSGVGDSVTEQAVVGTVHSEVNLSSSSSLRRGIQESQNYPQTRRSSAARERLQSSLARGFASNNASLGTGEGNDSSGESRNGVGSTLGGVGVGTSGGSSSSSRARRSSRTSVSGGVVHEEARDGEASVASVDRQSSGARGGGGSGGVAYGRNASRNDVEGGAGCSREANNGELVRQDADWADVAEDGSGIADAAVGII